MFRLNLNPASSTFFGRLTSRDRIQTPGGKTQKDESIKQVNWDPKLTPFLAEIQNPNPDSQKRTD